MHRPIDTNTPESELEYKYWAQIKRPNGKLETVTGSFAAVPSDMEWAPREWEAIRQMSCVSGARTQRVLILVPKG